MLHKDIHNRLRAGAKLILVEESDEELAVASAKVAAKAFEPVLVISAADPEAVQKLEAHQKGEGTLILCDFLRSYGTNPPIVRLIREMALQQRPQSATPGEDVAFSRLILLEVPGVEVPATLRTDIEYLTPQLPTVAELLEELLAFVKGHNIKLAANPELRHGLASAVAGLGRHEAARLFARCHIENGELDAVWLRKQKALRVSERLGGALTFIDTSDVPEVGGLGALKKWLDQRKDAFASEAAKKFGLPEPKGLLLAGVPGTGKSLNAKRISKSWGLPALRLDLGRLFGSLVGQSEAQTRQAIDAAVACSPCILWIDEIEKALAGASGALDSGTSARMLGALLTWMQEKTAPVFVVATANDISALPPEMLRKGRFDEIFFVDLPTLEERAEIVRIHLKRHGRKPDAFKVLEIARATDGFSGAEIEQAVIDGLFVAFADKRDLKNEDILGAARGTTPLLRTMETKIQALRKWADGHARPATAKPNVQQAESARRVAVS